MKSRDTMLRTLVFALLCLTIAPVSNCQEVFRLEMKALLVNVSELTSEYEDPAFGGGRKRVEIALLLRNASNGQLRVVTGEGGLSVGDGPGGIVEIAVSHSMPRSARGETIVPPDSKLGLVTLQNGEVALVKILFRTNMAIEVGKVRVRYTVSKEIGDRFGAWYGTSTAPLGQ